MRRGDGWIPILALALTAVGVVMVYSSTAIIGITRYQDPDHFLVRHHARCHFHPDAARPARRRRVRRGKLSNQVTSHKSQVASHKSIVAVESSFPSDNSFR